MQKFLLSTASAILLSQVPSAAPAERAVILAQAATPATQPDPKQQKKQPGQKSAPPAATKGPPPAGAKGPPPAGAKGPPPSGPAPATKGTPPAKQPAPTQAQPPAKQPASSPPAATGTPAAKQPPATQAQPPAKQPPSAPTTPAAKGTPPAKQPPATQAQPPAKQVTPPQPPAAQKQPPATSAPVQAQPPAKQTPPAQPPAAVQQPATQQPPAAQAVPRQPAPRLTGPLAPTAPQDNARRLDQIRGERRETREGDRLVIREPGRVIIQEGGRSIIRHDEGDRFRIIGGDVRTERRGNDTVTVIVRPDGTRLVSVVDDNGRLIRRSRQWADGREVVIIDNRFQGAPTGSFFVELPPPVIRIPRERYIVETERASPADIFAALIAPPVDRIERRYTLDEVRFSPALRERMPRVDIDTVTFETGSWDIAPDQMNRLAPIAQGILQAVQRNPGEVFLIEGHTDAVGNSVDNLSLSDHRAESVAVALTEQFQVPAENLTTQGYGEQNLKVPSQGPERQNRRVTVRRITPLLSGQN